MRSLRLRATVTVFTAVTLLASCGTSAGQGEPAASGSLASSPSATSVPTGSPSLPSEPPLTPRPTTSALTAGSDAWVSVSVATLWRTPSAARPVDRPALASPVRIRAWLAAMTLPQRRGLSGRADTQALLGDRVRVVRLRGHWVQVVVPDQPTPRDRRGYPGWVPARQLTAQAPADSTRLVTVTRPTAWLRADENAAAKVVEISFGTQLPYKDTVGGFVRVTTPLGAVRRINASGVSVHTRQVPALPRTRASLVTTAQLFSGLPYLWAGASGFGPDCSGLIWVDYRAHGITIPRDAAAQAVEGMPVATTAVHRGDLLFYATDGVVDHVTMYAGDGLMVHAPHTGGSVETVPVATAGYASARSYLR